MMYLGALLPNGLMLPSHYLKYMYTNPSQHIGISYYSTSSKEGMSLVTFLLQLAMLNNCCIPNCSKKYKHDCLLLG